VDARHFVAKLLEIVVSGQLLIFVAQLPRAAPILLEVRLLQVLLAQQVRLQILIIAYHAVRILQIYLDGIVVLYILEGLVGAVLGVELVLQLSFYQVNDLLQEL